MARTYIPAIRRVGRTVANEEPMRAALGRGDEVFTKLNGVYFAVTVKADGAMGFEALTERPDEITGD
jgi:hypothetical protein